MNRAVFFDQVRARPFGGRLTQTQVDGMNAVLEEAARLGWPLTWTAYLLATVQHETASTMRWDIREFGRGAGRRYGQPAGPWGLVYYGRSWPQLTWYENYVKQAPKLGVALDRDPDLMLTLPVATRVTFGGMADGDFTGRKLADYLDGPTPNFVEARRIVNGTDRAHAIARLADAFLAALMAADTRASVTAPAPTPANNPDSRQDALGGAGAAAGGGSAVAVPEAAPDAAWASWGGLAVLALALGWLAWRHRRWLAVHLSILADGAAAALRKI